MTDRADSSDNMADFVADSDTGGRNPDGTFSRNVLWYVPLVWSLYQLWIASPLPFVLGMGLWNDTQTRAIHLGFAVLLAFLAFPAFKGQARNHIPILTWITAIVAATGATRSRAYELRDAIVGVLPTLCRSPGRPKTQREPVADSVLTDVRGEALRFCMQHPGCVHDRPGRSRYAESFRLFVVQLRQRHADLPLADFAKAILVPVGTLEDWLRPGADPGPTEPPPSAAA